MPTSNLPQNQDEKDFLMRFPHFLADLRLEICFAYVMLRKKNVFLLSCFSNISSATYSLIEACICSKKTGSFSESFSKNTFYRFLNGVKTNWLRFTTQLSKAVADTIEPLTASDQVNAFVIDDSLFERTSYKKTELGLKVFDHASMRYTKGFRLLTPGGQMETLSFRSTAAF